MGDFISKNCVHCRTKKKICMIDLKGQNRSLLDLRTVGFDDNALPWQSGLSQTSGMRNK